MVLMKACGKIGGEMAPKAEGIYKNGDLIKLIGRWNEDGTEKKDAFWWE